MKLKKFLSLRNVIIFSAVCVSLLVVFMGGEKIWNSVRLMPAQILPGQDIINKAQVTYKSASGASYGPTFSNEVRVTKTAGSTGNFSFSLAREGRTNLAGTADIVFKSVSTGAVVKTVAVTASALGSGTSPNPTELVSGTTYAVVLKIPYCLTRRLGNVVWSNSASLTFPQVLAGNLNNTDNTINTLDWSVMNSKWRTADAVADINGDGIVNTIDWGFMNKNWRAIGEE